MALALFKPICFLFHKHVPLCSIDFILSDILIYLCLIVMVCEMFHAVCLYCSLYSHMFGVTIDLVSGLQVISFRDSRRGVGGLRLDGHQSPITPNSDVTISGVTIDFAS